MDTFKILFFISLLGLVSSCGGSASEEETETVTATLSSIQTNILTPTCAIAGCHSSGSASGGLVLEGGSSFGTLVNVESTESSLKRVLPGDPNNSYLIHKLEGTQTTVGGSGSQMPRGGASLSDTEIQTIKDWITAGATNN